MKIMLINSPSRKGAAGFLLPLGLLYVGGIIERCGHSAKIVDPYLDGIDLDNFSLKKLFEGIEEYNPDVIGFGGIASSYGSTKYLSREIRSNYPEIFQVAGGPLSSTYKLLLTNTNIDLIFHGETEISLPIFLSKFADLKFYYDVPGVSYYRTGSIIRNNVPKQVKDLDIIPYPDYKLIDLYKYLHRTQDWLASHKLSLSNNYYYPDILEKLKNKEYYIPIITSRGCTHKCLFCYRHFKGIRKHSVNYVLSHMQFLIDSFGIHGFQFVDELFNPNEEWVKDFCDALAHAKLDIYFLIGGARVDKICPDLLKRLKEVGCVEITYGQESGSDVILKEYRKGVTSALNKEITLATKSIGLNSPIQLVIGSPGETTSTIRETIQFLKDVDAPIYSLNYLIPLPETPIWNYVEQNHLIDNVEQYLDRVAEVGGTEPLVNLTKCPDHEWRRWQILIRKELVLHFSHNKKHYYYYQIMFGLIYFTLYFVSKDILRQILPKRLILWLKTLLSGRIYVS